MTLDDLRRAHPGLGFALYAYDPGGPVTLEVHDAGQVYTFSGASESEAIGKAFPEPPPGTRTDLDDLMDDIAAMEVYAPADKAALPASIFD